MEILLFISIICLLLLLGYLFLLKRELRAVTKQLELVQEIETNKQLLTDFQDGDVVLLVDTINQFIQLKKLAEQDNFRQNQRLREMILNMSHDLRTPLTSIRGYMQMLELEEVSPEKKKQYIKIINQKILVLNELINNFFELSKLEADDYPFELEPVDLSQLLKEALVRNFADFERLGIELTIDLPDELLIDGNVSALERVFQNLFDNCIKHQATTIEVRGSSKADTVHINITNDAEDFNARNLPFIFDKFATFSENSGNGLGLSIVKEFVAKLEGDILAHYRKGMFTIELIFPIRK